MRAGFLKFVSPAVECPCQKFRLLDSNLNPISQNLPAWDPGICPTNHLYNAYFTPKGKSLWAGPVAGQCKLSALPHLH